MGLDKMELKGTRHKWEEYNKAIVERWEEVLTGLFRCKLHDTVFSPYTEDGKPCWSCWDEFEEEL